MPSSVVEIEQLAFADQSQLISIAMPGVKYIGDEAFKNCSNLALSTKCDQPILRYVGAKAFYFCSKFTIDSANELYYIGEYAFCSTGIKSINIGPYITFMDTDPFTSCSSLEEIIISNEIPPKLGGALFYGSTNPQRIKVPMSALDTYLASSD
ncbi:MAG: leucine-rich repeat domain-containing protein [Mycoplasmoidaceae bacterium]|nr:leucine-rich repeat domain-containing protein [Mycoplasmoidaceae bacterium]